MAHGGPQPGGAGPAGGGVGCPHAVGAGAGAGGTGGGEDPGGTGGNHRPGGAESGGCASCAIGGEPTADSPGDRSARNHAPA
ncbi:MAG: hypothetical protein E6G00_06020 [Actinobacteria bacterium]|nr:MAG: hypothetical protein E6G00_06020 [Actinomycetota bacterium]